MVPFQRILRNDSLLRLKPALLKTRVLMLLPSLLPPSWPQLSLKLLSMTAVTMVVPICKQWFRLSIIPDWPSSVHVRKLSLVWSGSHLSHLLSSMLSPHRCWDGLNSLVMWRPESGRMLLVVKVLSALLVRTFMLHHHLNIHFMTFYCSSVLEIWSQTVQNFKRATFCRIFQQPLSQAAPDISNCAGEMNLLHTVFLTWLHHLSHLH